MNAEHQKCRTWRHRFYLLQQPVELDWPRTNGSQAPNWNHLKLWLKQLTQSRGGQQRDRPLSVEKPIHCREHRMIPGLWREWGIQMSALYAAVCGTLQLDTHSDHLRGGGGRWDISLVLVVVSKFKVKKWSLMWGECTWNMQIVQTDLRIFYIKDQSVQQNTTWYKFDTMWLLDIYLKSVHLSSVSQTFLPIF